MVATPATSPSFNNSTLAAPTECISAFCVSPRKSPTPKSAIATSIETEETCRIFITNRKPVAE